MEKRNPSFCLRLLIELISEETRGRMHIRYLNFLRTLAQLLLSKKLLFFYKETNEYVCVQKLSCEYIYEDAEEEPSDSKARIKTR